MADDSAGSPVTVEQQLSLLQKTQREHGVALRSIADGIAQLLDLLSPKVTDGPTLDEILAQLVSQIGDQGIVVRRIEGDTIEIRTVLGTSRADHAEKGTGAGSPTNGKVA